MKLAAAHLPSTARSCAQRLLVTWVLLLAFTLQSYVTQTHFHGAASSGDRAPVVKILGQTSARGPAGQQGQGRNRRDEKGAGGDDGEAERAGDRSFVPRGWAAC